MPPNLSTRILSVVREAKSDLRTLLPKLTVDGQQGYELVTNPPRKKDSRPCDREPDAAGFKPGHDGYLTAR